MKSTEKSTEKSTSQVLPTSQKPTGRQSTQTRTEKSTEKSTGKSAKSTKILLKPPIESATMKSTRWSPKRTSNDESMPSTDDPRLQDIFSRACGSTAQSSDSASALELGKYNHFRETYVLGVYEWDYTQLTYTIDDR